MAQMETFRKEARFVVARAEAIDVRNTLISMFQQEPLTCVDDDTCATAELVIAEVLNNIVEHAYVGLAGKIEITVKLHERGLDVAIIDDGRPMPNECLPPGQPIDLGVLDELPEGGWGWHLIRSLTEGLAYNRAQNRNFLRFHVPIQANAA